MYDEAEDHDDEAEESESEKGEPASQHRMRGKTSWWDQAGDSWGHDTWREPEPVIHVYQYMSERSAPWRRSGSAWSGAKDYAKTGRTSHKTHKWDDVKKGQRSSGSKTQSDKGGKPQKGKGNAKGKKAKGVDKDGKPKGKKAKGETTNSKKPLKKENAKDSKDKSYKGKGRAKGGNRGWHY